MSDQLDKKLNEVFAGKVVRKDLVHQIKKAANVPSFVLEFLLSKYCATDDPNEIEAGKRAVLEVIESNYVRPDESNSAQSKVQQLGRHKFIDKIHVKYHEKERRHWAEMENFGSKRIAINEKFYKENGKLLEGGMWAEITLAHNEVEEDNYAFYIEDLRPIQLARFNEAIYFEGRKQFTRDEWIDVILRSVGLNPEIMDNPPPEIKAKFPSGFRLKMHFLSRLLPIVQNNYNYIELGPRGTGKSYFYSEFSPYSTLLSGGQASTATLLYNNRKEQVGAVGFWDNIAFDEVGNMKIKDSDTVQIMKDYMANGRFSRGKEVIANASFSFVGNIDQSVDQLVNSYDHNLFVTLPKAFDLAIQDRFYFYLPGWEIPKMDNKFFTQSFGLITDYMAEAFHYMFKHNKDYVDIVGRRLKLGPNIQGRDESAIRKTVTAYIKLIHPAGEPSEEEFNQLVEFAIEGRRRVKEQMNKAKPDDEFALIDLSYFKSDGTEVIVYCPESRNSEATHNPRKIEGVEKPSSPTIDRITISTEDITPPQKQLEEKRIKVLYSDTGYGYETIFKDYVVGASEITLEDAYIRQKHQINNFLRLCEIIVKEASCKKLTLITSSDDEDQKKENILVFDQIANSLFEHDIEFRVEFSEILHDRELKMNNGWNIKMGRGLDYFQSLGGNYFQIGTNDLDLRPCLETSFDFYKSN
ncbi:MAG: BREX system Lon protease-like protein BrxL [Bacteroidota bacterium]